jgi:predicted nucleic acid-binding protein
MISALDSSIILDVLTEDAQHADASERLLRRASSEGQLVVCECVLAEIRPVFADPDSLDLFLSDWQVQFIPSSKDCALLAGQYFTAYLKRGGKGGRVVSDFLIGAHAQTHADRLLARDRGYWRDYFKGLKVLDPGKQHD